MAPSDTGHLPPGKIFHGHYEVVRCISTGAMGAVYEVIDQKTLRRRALKLMLPSIVSDAAMRERFKLEATITADVISEHIVETFDADVDADTGAPFIVMELLRGDDLADSLDSRGRMSATDVVGILAQAARALDKTHAVGIVHRDLKPENIFITHRDDGTPRVKLLDFGIAKVTSGSAHATKQKTINLGTPPYMSPEQIMGDGTIDHRADLYALGHIAYALLVGEPYWLEEVRTCESLYALLLRICSGVKEPPVTRAQRYGVTLPPAFDAWFQRATALLPALRFDRASDLVLALAQALDVPLAAWNVRASAPEWKEHDASQPSRGGVEAPSAPPKRKQKRRGALWLVSALGALLLVSFGAFFAVDRASRQEPGGARNDASARSPESPAPPQRAAEPAREEPPSVTQTPAAEPTPSSPPASPGPDKLPSPGKRRGTVKPEPAQRDYDPLREL